MSSTAGPPSHLSDRPMTELTALRNIDPPPSFVASVMTRVSEPRLPSLWQWLRRPIPIEIRISPLALIGLTLALGAVFVFIGATMK